MSEQGEIVNKVANSGLVNIDVAEFRPKGKRLGIDLKDFLYEGFILREKDFREQVENLDVGIYENAFVYLYCSTDAIVGIYENAFVYLYCSTDAIVPLWAYFLLTSKLEGVAKKIVFGSLDELELVLFHEEIQKFDFSDYKDKRVLIRGCSEVEIPTNAYVELVQKLKPMVKSLMFGEACSSVPIYKK